MNLTVTFLLEICQKDCSLPHRLDHCGNAASFVDFVEDPALCRTELCSRLFDLGSDESAANAPQQIRYAYFLEALI